jgi:hypothetical protein
MSLNDVITGAAALAHPAVLPLTAWQHLTRSGKFSEMLTQLGGRESGFVPLKLAPSQSSIYSSSVPRSTGFPLIENTRQSKVVKTTKDGQTTSFEPAATIFVDPVTQKPTFSLADQQTAVQRLRELGYDGPLTRSELGKMSIIESQNRLRHWLETERAKPVPRFTPVTPGPLANIQFKPAPRKNY